MSKGHKRQQAGAALMTVLLIVGAMSAVAVSLTHGLTESIKRSRALEAQAQLRLLAVAAGEVAESRLTALVMQTGGKLTADLPGFSEPIRFPLQGGMLEISVTDESNCFDVNQLAANDSENEDAGGANQDPSVDFKSILAAADVDPGIANELAAGIADWIDPDLSSRLGGAEDGYYSQLRPPYRTSGLALENESELRAIRGFDPALMAQIDDLVCVIPAHNEVQERHHNINTLGVDQAALLVPVFGETLSSEEIGQVIANRPLGGWASLEDFLGDPALTNVSPDVIRRTMLSTESSFVAMRARVSYGEQAMVMSYLFELTPGASARLLRRERVS